MAKMLLKSVLYVCLNLKIATVSGTNYFIYFCQDLSFFFNVNFQLRKIMFSNSFKEITFYILFCTGGFHACIYFT